MPRAGGGLTDPQRPPWAGYPHRHRPPAPQTRGTAGDGHPQLPCRSPNQPGSGCPRSAGRSRPLPPRTAAGRDFPSRCRRDAPMPKRELKPTRPLRLTEHHLFGIGMKCFSRHLEKKRASVRKEHLRDRMAAGPHLSSTQNFPGRQNAAAAPSSPNRGTGEGSEHRFLERPEL